MKYFLKIVLGMNYRDTHHYQDIDQFIIIANHNSHIDTMAILSSLPFKFIANTHPVAAADYFANNSVKSFISNIFVNILPIHRKRKSRKLESPIEAMISAVKSKRNLIIYPEGSRGNPGEIKEFKKGVLKILRELPYIPYIPVYLHETGQALPKGDPILIPFQSYMKVGKAQYIDNQLSDSENLDLMKESIFSLKAQN